MKINKIIFITCRCHHQIKEKFCNWGDIKEHYVVIGLTIIKQEYVSRVVQRARQEYLHYKLTKWLKKKPTLVCKFLINFNL